MTITPRKRRIVEALKPHLRHGPKTALVDAVDALLAEAEQATRQDEREALNRHYGWEATLALCTQEFKDRTSMQRHPLQGTHVNDVPVIAAELVRKAFDNAIRARDQGQAEAAE